MEALLTKFVKGLENHKSFIKEIKVDISRLSPKVELYATVIK